MKKLNKTDYNKIFEDTVAGITDAPRLVLHVCCAPCSTAVILRLGAFDVMPFFYNPNIDTAAEYELRARTVAGFLPGAVIAPYEPSEFYAVADGKRCEPEGGKRCEPEGGKRCEACIGLRIMRTAEYARETGARYFCSTLSVSPHKNARLINQLGEQAEARYGVKYLPNDFKKKNGYLESVRISREKGLYRQSYCGCEFSRGQAGTDVCEVKP